MKKRTKIVATIGPSSNNIETIKQLAEAGVNVMRINFSHGDYKEQGEKIERIKSCFKNQEVSILQDLPGIKIRLGKFDKPFEVETGEEVVFSSKSVEGSIPVDYPDFEKIIKEGGKVLIEDGTKSFKVLDVDNDKVLTRAEISGSILPRKGINIPWAELKESSFTEEDKKHLKFGIEHGINLVALSFVESKESILEAKDFLKKNGGEDIAIIAKIETRYGLKNIDEIIEAADGIMVARGDLGVQVPFEEVPFLQTTLIEKALRVGKPVVVATQMLKSMTENTRPSRAEVTDVANAALERADAVMLSEEVAVGDYPVESVKAMNSVLIHAEAYAAVHYTGKKDTNGVAATIAQASVRVAEENDAEAIFVFTQSGSTARLVSRHRPKQKIYALTPNSATRASLNLSWGVKSFLVDLVKNIDEADSLVKRVIEENNLDISGSYVFVAGLPFDKPGDTNVIYAGKV